MEKERKLEKNRIQLLKETHPKQYKWFIKVFKEVLDFMNYKYE